MKKIFYSWQSDANRKVNHDFIGDCLREAAAAITRDSGQEFEVQDGVRGEPGTPALAETIFARIAAADIYVADISLVFQAVGGDEERLSPNPNVAIELGYAIASLSLARVISIQNEHFGAPDKLPFDLQHLRWPLRYSLQSSAPKDEIAKAKPHLTRALQHAIVQVLKDDRPRAVVLAKRAEVASVLANLVEQTHTWQLALKRHPLDAPNLKSKGLALTQKLLNFSDGCQRALNGTSGVTELESMRLAIVEATLLIAGSPQRTESLAHDLAETKKLRKLLEDLKTSNEQIEASQRELSEIEAEIVELAAEKALLEAELSKPVSSQSASIEFEERDRGHV